MTTTFEQLMAAMAFDAYRPTDENLVDLPPEGWSIDRVLSRPNRGDGFDATAFHSGSSQVVIAFRGTDTGTIVDTVSDWTDNVPAGAGWRSDQVELAIETVADVLAKYPNAQIQLTGHSLGGGLASLMAVFFELPAYVFAPAPFELSAIDREASFLALPGLPPVLSFQDSDLVQEYFQHYKAYRASHPYLGKLAPLSPAL